MSVAHEPPRRTPGHPSILRRAPELERLTGIRSGKPSFYPEFRHNAERLRRVIHALEQISAALLTTVEGSDALVRAVAAVAADHLSADWVVFALVDGELPDARPRHLVLDHDGQVFTDPRRLPAQVAAHVRRVSRGVLWEDHDGDARRRHAHVPVTLGGRVVGGIVVWTGPDREIDDTDETVLRILAGQTAAALRNCALYQDLAFRNAELLATQAQLSAAQQREVLDSERHRIARELHDSVTQYALSAGMQIELCRREITDRRLRAQLDTAKSLTGRAVEQLRSAIYALNDADLDGEHGLPALLQRLSGVHMADNLRVEVRIAGTPATLPAATERSLVRIVGEALFNTAVHAEASRAVVRLAYRDDRVLVSVSDDGRGDPEEVRRCLRTSAAGCLSGEHRGLANMHTRALELGGTLAIRRARQGGLAVEVSIPVPR